MEEKMKKFNKFMKNTILGGVIIALPVMLTFYLLRWLFNLLSGMIRPFTGLFVHQVKAGAVIADILGFLIMILLCFLIGVIISTRIGKYVFSIVDRRLFAEFPGYRFFRDTVQQLFGDKKKSFSKVAMVKIFDQRMYVTAFITDEHDNGMVSVFVPSALNPTTGLVLHLDRKYIHPLDVSPDVALRSIIGCGTNSGDLVRSL